jgi:dihydrofolate synthase/folylpolyglutamate synthase
MPAELLRVLSKMDNLVDWEATDRAAGITADLLPIRDLLERAGHPQRTFRSVHIAGTKGKGSVGALIEAGLASAGLSCGRYSSPHVETVTERVTFGGQNIAGSALARALERALLIRFEAAHAGTPGGDATRFDIETLAAILAFQEAGVEWAIVECGLGGRHDSTNVIDAELAILTNVGLEHTTVLGDTLAAIAYQKVGILKPGATMVTGVQPESKAGSVVRSAAAALGSQAIYRPPQANDSLSDINRRLAGAALDELGRRGVTTNTSMPSAVGAGLLDSQAVRSTSLPGRLERFELPFAAEQEAVTEPIQVILDGAHVPFSVEAVLTELARGGDLPARCVAVLGIARDKSMAEIVQVLQGRVCKVICTEASSGPPRRSAGEIADCATGLGLPCERVDKAEDALLRALALAASVDGWVLVTGSLRLVGEVRPIVRRLAGQLTV